jgi:Domain of unknown function (DUF4288)
MTSGERWFSVRLLFESTHLGRGGAPALFEDRMLLVRAESIEAAKGKAEAIARRSGEGYRAASGDEVVWRFEEVLDAKEVLDEAIADGTEIYYSHIRGAEVDQLRRMLQPFED